MSTIISDAGFTFANGDTQAYPAVPVRQTVLSGAVDTNGFSAFGGSTGSATVTAAATLIATAANGVTNRTGSIVNPAFTGLSTNGTMYMFMDTNADGTCTTGTGALAPIYQWGGTPSVTSGQFTFNIQEMKGYVGNGSTAVQTYRVYVGEVTVAGAVVTAIVWYALMGQYDSGYTSTLPGAAVQVTKNHNLGLIPNYCDIKIKCLTAELNYSVGDVMLGAGGTAVTELPMFPVLARNTCGFIGNTTNSFWIQNKTTGAFSAPTAANWAYCMTARRGW